MYNLVREIVKTDKLSCTLSVVGAVSVNILRHQTEMIRYEAIILCND